MVIAGHIESGETKWGTYHFAGADAVSWHGFAEAILALAAAQLAGAMMAMSASAAVWRGRSRSPRYFPN